MIAIKAQQYLTAEGHRYFPQWIREAGEVLASIEGFVRLEQLECIDEPEEAHMMMVFKSITAMRAWGQSEVHRTLAAKLHRFHTQPPVKHQFIVAQSHSGD